MVWTGIQQRILLCSLLVVLALVGCRRESADGGLVSQGTLTPTPRSTPLPSVATAVPPGAEGNPLRMVIYSDAPRLAETFVSRMEEAIAGETGLVVEIVLVQRYAEALAALCNSAAGEVTVTWLNGITYAAANAQNCGTAALQVERGRRANARTGEAAVIITAEGRNISSIAQLEGDVFCRLSNTDFYSWVIPSLVLKASGVDPLRNLEAVNDYDDAESLLRAVLDGDCDGAGLAQTTFDELDAEGITVLSTTVDLPYSVLMYPIELPLDRRLALTDTLLKLAQDTAGAEIMRGLLAQDALVPAADEDFADLISFVNGSGLDFAQLGN